MDVMSSDVSLKIRSAIKAKLVELGAYVDEELPDYIMVMVANKKTKGQMTDDLMLFLGNNTDKFTTWLHEVLDRLQSVTSESKKKNDSKLKEKMEGKFTDNTIVRGKAVKIQRSQEEKFVSKRSREDPDESQEEVLAIKADFDADELLVEDMPEEIVVIPTMNKNTSIKQQNIVSPMQRSDVYFQKNDLLSGKKDISNNNESGRFSRHCLKRSSSVIDHLPLKQRIPNSAIGSIVHHQLFEDDDEEEEFNTRIGGLASVIRVSERRPSLPPKMQANKNLILKAMEEAKNSVIAAAKKAPVKIEPFKKLHKESYLYRNKKVDSQKSSRKCLRRTDHVENNLIDDDDESMTTVEEKDSTVNLSAVTSLSCSYDDDSLTSEYARRIVHDSQMEEPKTSTPKFIVTLDGVDPDFFLNKPKGSVLKGVRSHDVDESETLISPIPMDLDEPEDDVSNQLAVLHNLPQTKKQKIAERCKYWPACKNGDSCFYHHPTVQCKTFPKCKYADKCLYIHPNCKFDAACNKKLCPYTHASKRQIRATSPVRNSKPVPLKEIKCKFFPHCTNMNCKFYHPKACRYGLSCTQVGCIYAHPPLPSRDKLKWISTMQSSQQMRFPVQKETVS